MKPAKLILFVALLCAALSTWDMASQAKDNKAEVALQAAIKTEAVDGNLKGAIEQYQRLGNGGDRAVAAKALVRMGRCYEKLGDAQAREARRAYDRVVRDFDDQKDMVAAAQARLAALNHTASGPSVVARRVWAGPGVNTDGAPSWDGRYIIFTDGTTGNIALRDLAGGETRLLTKNADNRGHAVGRSLMAPDGKSIAYTWGSDGAAPVIRLVGLDGAAPRVLYRARDATDIELGAWSPDGTRLAAVVTAKGDTGGLEVNRIALISSKDGSARILKTLGPRRAAPRGFSPDGRFLACSYPPRDDAESRDIYALAVDGGQEVPLVEHPADDRLLGWLPNGKGILFASDRPGPRGIWYLPVAEGRPKGSPELLKSEMGEIEPLGFTRNGSFFFGIESGGMAAYEVALDPAALRLLSAPALIRKGANETTQHPLFSPDGQYLVYVANRIANRWLLCVRSLKTGEEREHPISFDLEHLRKMRWAVNGRGVYISGTDVELHHLGFYRIDIPNGEATAILSSNPEADALDGRFTPDGKSLILSRAGFAFADNAARILQRDLATGQERELYRAPLGREAGNLVLTADGRQLAFTLHFDNGIRSFDEIWVMSDQGADARALLRLSGRESIRRDGLVWTPDGRRLLFAKAIETSGRTFRLELWQISTSEKEPLQIGVLAEAMAFGGGSCGLSIDPAGTRIAFQAGRRQPDVWVMEDVQGAPKSAAVPLSLNEVTAEAWIKPSSLGSDFQTILAKGNYNYDGAVYQLALNPAGKIWWGVRHGHTFFGDGGDSSIDAIAADAGFRPDTWYHVVGTIYSARSASVYINGALLKTGPITQTIPYRPTEPLRIGSVMYYGLPASLFKGAIDEVEVYDRVLSEEEIRQRYLAGLARHKSGTRDPVSHAE